MDFTHHKVPMMYMLLIDSCRSKLATVLIPADCKLNIVNGSHRATRHRTHN